MWNLLWRHICTVQMTTTASVRPPFTEAPQVLSLEYYCLYYNIDQNNRLFLIADKVHNPLL